MFFSNGYGYVPQPDSPFKAVSPPEMAIFLPGDMNDTGSPYAAGVKPGEIGAGPRASVNAFWFNAYGAYLGCDNAGPEGCEMDIRGFKWDSASRTEVLAAQYTVELPACPSLHNCNMTSVDFIGPFSGLSGVQIWATVNRTIPQIFFMDNLRMGW